MIFVTVGGQLPFDRLIHTVDAWAKQQSSAKVFAQIGASKAPPENIEWTDFLSPGDFRAHAANASLVVSHAGIGSILTAIDLGRPILVLPRRSALGEHRNDHQWATVSRLRADLGIGVARDERELIEHLEHAAELKAPVAAPSEEHERLLRFVRRFVE